MNRWDALALVLGILLLGGAILLWPMPETEITYHYSVKTEQVQNAGEVEDSIDYSNLSSAEKDLLYGAFRDSDEFLSGSSVDVTRSEKLPTFDGWKIVRVEGVPLLVAIDGPNTYKDVTHTDSGMGLLSVVLFVAGFYALVWGVRKPFVGAVSHTVGALKTTKEWFESL